MTEQEIQKKTQDKYATWYNAPYDFEPLLPEDFTQRFERSLFKCPPEVHKLHVDKLKEMRAKPVTELTRLEMGIMMNVIMAASFDVLYTSLDEALEKHSILEEIQKSFNKKAAELQNELIREQNALMRIANPSFNPHTSPNRLEYNKIK